MRLNVLNVLAEKILLVDIIEGLDGELDVGHTFHSVRHKGDFKQDGSGYVQLIATAAREIFTHDDAQHLKVLGIRRHGVGGHDPAALAELMGDGELAQRS